MAQACADACREYLSSLEDLTFNSKPHINMLTILAEENLHAAKDIVAIIEAQISKAPAAEKLPVLYLVDSIVKNVGGEYLAVFAKNLVTSFICVFEKVDEGTRKSLFKLRSTWDDVFPLKKLYALDVRVNSVDPAWPIKPLPPTVNASSIHVNPRFLMQAEESSPRASPPRPSAPPPAPPLAPPPPAVSLEASLTQEQLIRQQLLAKQKQLLELQQKKIELELEQTKAQLAGNFVLNPPPIPPPPSQTPPSPAAPPPVTRDPRLNRNSGSGSRSKDQVSAPSSSPGVRPKEQKVHAPQAATHRPKDHAPLASAPRPAAPRSNKEHQAGPPTRPPAKREAGPPTERRVVDKQKGGGGGVPRREAASSEHQKSKSKSPSPIVPPPKGRGSDIITPPPKVRGSDIITPPPKGRGSDIITPPTKGRSNEPLLKKDPRLLQPKRLPEKTGEDDIAKKRQIDRKEREEVSGGGAKKLANGSLGKREQHGQSGERGGEQRGQSSERGGEQRSQSSERGGEQRGQSSERGGELKTGGGNARTNARKRSRSPTPPPFPCSSSPKRKERRRSPSLSPGGGKTRRPATPRKRTKRPPEERDSPRVHHSSSSSSSDAKEPPLHSRRSAWEESKHLKQSEEAHGKCGPQRHVLQKSYSTPPPARPPHPGLPRTPKHRLSVDANLQIPDVLNSASKRDLLRRASRRLESGEISQEDFLNVAHQIKQLFQYREEKKMAPPPGASPSPQALYYQHKSKLRRTQLASQHQGAPQRCSAGEEEPDEEEEESEGAARTSRERDRAGERSSKEREEHHTPMIEEYNHGKDFPSSRKALQSLPRFRRKADLRDTAEREWTSPLSERQRYEERSGGERERSGYDPPLSRRLPPPHHTPPPPPPPRKCPSPPVVAPGPPPVAAPPQRGPSPLAFERERLSPLQTDSGGLSPAPRFESPNSVHSDDMETSASLPPHHHHHHPHPDMETTPLPAPLPRSILKVPGSSPPVVPHTPLPPRPRPPTHHYDNGPSHPPQQGGGGGRFDEPLPHHHGPMRGFDGPARPPVGQQQPRRFDEHFDGPMRRFQQHRPPMQRFDGPAHMGPGPMRFEGPVQPGPMRFEGPNQPGPMRFEGPNQPMRFDGPGQPGPMRFDAPNQPQPMRFEAPNQPQPMRFDAPNQPGPMRFEAPNQPQPMRFEAPNQPQPMRFEGPAQSGPMMFEGPGQPGPMAGPGLRFDMSNHQQQPFHQPMGMHFEQPPPRFPSGPMGPMGGPMGGPPMGGPGPGPFSSMPGLQYQPGPLVPFPGPVGPGFYNPGPPQQVNMVPNMTQAFLPQNTVPFTQTVAPPVAPDSHFGQMDVNELLTKLISTGIIPAAAPPTRTAGSTDPSPSAPVEEEEEEEEELDDNIPDITSFNMDDLKQRYEPVVVKLYTGIQCYSCGMRFTASQTDVYADHLDWHYRHNRSEKDVSRKVTHRRWYYSLTDWIEFEEVADLEERSKSLFFEKVNEEEVQKTQEMSKQKDVVSSVKAATDVVDESCEICAEPFEMYWEEEEEEWHLKNAIRVDDKTYHPSCYEDYKNTCSFGEATPSPSTASNQHPLSAFKQEDTPPSSCQFAGKQEEEMEAEEEGGGVKEIKQEVVEEEEAVSEEAGL